MADKRKNRGMGLVEIIIGSAIITLGILGIITTFNIYISYARVNQYNVEASFLLEESMEVVTLIRDKGWTANIAPLTSGTEYYLDFDGANWATSTTPTYVDNRFVQSFIVSDVNRDGSDQIAASGTNDPETKLITVKVSFWQGNATTTESLTSYITNLNND